MRYESVTCYVSSNISVVTLADREIEMQSAEDFQTEPRQLMKNGGRPIIYEPRLYYYISEISVFHLKNYVSWKKTGL